MLVVLVSANWVNYTKKLNHIAETIRQQIRYNPAWRFANAAKYGIMSNTMKQNRFFRVLAAVPLSHVSGRKILTGVHRFLGEGYAWDIELVRRDNEFRRLFSNMRDFQSFDGMIIAFAEEPQTKRRQAKIDIPTVFIDYPDPVREKLRHRVFVHDNEHSIAAVAARHLLSCGNRRSFGYVPTREPTIWSELRRKAFEEKVLSASKKLLTFHGNGKSRDALIDWLRLLPKPAAVLAAFDDRAIDVLEACRAVGIGVPSDVAVLGIGNDETICETSTPPLSSVAVDFEAQGYRGARELQALMLGAANPKMDISFGGTETVQRASTPATVPTALVKRAMDFIREKAFDGISSKDVVNHLHVSRRLADLRFHEIRGQTILEAIMQIRLTKVKRLLAETNLNLVDIAERCGYSSSDVLRVLFKRATGLSPRNWRKKRNQT